ncbi:SWAP (Suppressor-of-White-APricot)/surpdomain-containing protein, partial [Striga asiatica]
SKIELNNKNLVCAIFDLIVLKGYLTNKCSIDKCTQNMPTRCDINHGFFAVWQYTDRMAWNLICSISKLNICIMSTSVSKASLLHVVPGDDPTLAALLDLHHIHPRGLDRNNWR